MKPVGVLRFLGTNCDLDVFGALESLEASPQWLWYEDQFNPADYSGFVLPGGFSYGDYLRSGALAAKAPVMKSLEEANSKGQPILGICNGFQILCEAQMLPGALIKNKGLKFIDRFVDLKSVTQSAWGFDQKIHIPIAHGDGCYFATDDVVKSLFDNDQVWLTYEDNPNGSVKDIAGLLNKNKNVAALMPHPERAMNSWMGSRDGLVLLNQFLELR